MPAMTLVANDPCGTGLHRLQLDAAPAGYTQPGQFVTAGPPGLKPSFFAIASSPGEPLELLVKASGDTAEALVALKPGATIEVSDAMGGGFPLDRVIGKPLLLLINGSGLSAARPIVRAELAAGLPRPVVVFYGVLSAEHRAYAEDLDAWTAAGVEVHTVLDPFFVQHIAQERGWVRNDVGVVLVGHKAMAEEARALFVAAGCPDDAVLTNF